MTGFFITGTDTGVGKTWFTARLCRYLRELGIRAGVWKPIQSGTCGNDPASDSARLKRGAGVDDDVDDICKFSLKSPLAPMVAAALEKKKVSCDDLMASSELLFRKYDLMLVEGVGGFAVPLNSKELMSDFAVRLNFPVIVMASPGLGTVNHTLLTVEAIRRRGLQVAGVVLNGYDTEPLRVNDWEELIHGTIISDSSQTNPLLIEQFAEVDVVGMIPTMNDDDEFKRYVNVKRILNTLKH